MTRRVAGAHGRFTIEDYRKWLKKAEGDEFALALGRLAELNQTKVYCFGGNVRVRYVHGGSLN